MRGMVPTVPWLLLLTALAGCAGDTPEPVMDEEVIEPGTIAGVVVDEAIRPLADARITLTPGDMVNQTGADGRFAFPDLDPGVYTVTASRAGHSNESVVTVVVEGAVPDSLRIVLVSDPSQTAFALEYKFNGMFECGGGVDDITCSNVNIITWIILGIGNVTNDRSLFLQWIDGPPAALQTELVWDTTQPLGDSLGFAVGGATEEQLATGMATTHNWTFGASPLMLTIPQPELGESGIGADRALLTQVVPAPYEEIPGGCVAYDPCGPGLQLMQPFESFTHAFYGFTPAPDWRFSEHGSPVPP